jgi:hypothetical protein
MRDANEKYFRNGSSLQIAVQQFQSVSGFGRAELVQRKIFELLCDPLCKIEESHERAAPINANFIY